LASTGKPTLHKGSQAASEKWRYDGNGNQVEEAYFGVDGRPTLSSEGVARLTMGYDEHGNKVDTNFFDVDGKPTLHKDGYARWTSRFDERGNAVERASFAVDGKLADKQSRWDRRAQLIVTTNMAIRRR